MGQEVEALTNFTLGLRSWGRRPYELYDGQRRHKESERGAQKQPDLLKVGLCVNALRRTNPDERQKGFMKSLHHESGNAITSATDESWVGSFRGVVGHLGSWGFEDVEALKG